MELSAKWHKLCYFMETNASGLLLHLFTKTNPAMQSFCIYLVSWRCAGEIVKSSFGFNTYDSLIYGIGFFE